MEHSADTGGVDCGGKIASAGLAVVVVVGGSTVVVVAWAAVVVVVALMYVVMVLVGVVEGDVTDTPMASPTPTAARMATAKPTRTTVERRRWIMGGSSSAMAGNGSSEWKRSR
jgi:hypothetical protein